MKRRLAMGLYASAIAMLVGAIAIPYIIKPSPFTVETVEIGTLADTVLSLRGKPMVTPSKIVGRDENGLLVEWEYPDAVYVMARRHKWQMFEGVYQEIEAYRVIKMTKKTPPQ
jgi:hypothetical protein